MNPLSVTIIFSIFCNICPTFLMTPLKHTSEVTLNIVGAEMSSFSPFHALL